MSQLMFWNKQNNNNNNNSNTNNNNNNNNSNNAKNNNNGANTSDAKKRNWLHQPDALVNGHIVYLVKFFGNLPVDQSKGIEVVKDAIRKLQFAQQMKKAETGTQEKFKKVEITISVDGVAVQEPRTQKILHQFPLHNISYCADEKGVKKFFSFIVKKTKENDNNTNGVHATNGGGGGLPPTTIGGGSNSSSNSSDGIHECFVFVSSKLASDITLTIGQAFDLAYRKYINNTEKSDLGKAQQQISELEKTIGIYKNRLMELTMKLPKSELDVMLLKMGIKDILEVPISENDEDKTLIDTTNHHSPTQSTLNNFSNSSSNSTAFVPIVPPRNNIPSHNKSNSQKMEELLLNSDSDSDFDPRADETIDSSFKSNNISGNDLFGFEPSNSYGQQLFYNNNDNKLLNNNNINANISSSNNNNNSFTNEFHFTTPPLLAPPPKVSAPRRSTPVTNTIKNNNNNNDLLSNGNNLDINIFSNKLNAVSLDDFSLESLDPLRK